VGLSAGVLYGLVCAATSHSQGEQAMYTREVHLVEIFAGETVVISAEGTELARSEKTVTDPRKGYAKILRISLPATTKMIDVALAGTEAKISVDVVPERLRHLRIFLNNGALTAEAVDEEQYRLNPRGFG
jgi:hypothetical protein